MKRVFTYRRVLSPALYAGVAAALLLAAGCSTTKRLGTDDVLYTGVKKLEVKSTTDEKVPAEIVSEVEEPLLVKPNNPLYDSKIRTPFPIGLWAYNAFYTEKTKGFKAWLYRRLAKKPVLVADVKPEQRVPLVEDILDNKGYFGSSAKYEIVPKNNPKKARISYRIDVPEPWTYSRITFPQAVDPITAKIGTLQAGSMLRVGERYDIDSLTAERIRITNILRNDNYYYFRPDYLEYQADTTQQRLEVDLRMVMVKGIPPQALAPYRIGELEVSLFNVKPGERDSMYVDGVKVTYDKPLKVRPKVLERALTIHPGGSSRVDSIGNTLNNLTKLGIFRYVNMSVTPLDSLSAGRDSLNMSIMAAFDMPMEANLEMNFSSKSNSFIGPGLIFGIKHKNIFRGGELLSVDINADYEWQTGNSSAGANASAINSYEFGLNASLRIPRLMPRFMPLIKRYDAKTTLNIGANLLNRPQFFKMLAFNMSGGYDFQTSPQSFHNLTLFKLVYNRLLGTTAEFDRTMAANPAIAMSFKDQFIPSISYTYTLDRKYGRENRVVWTSTAMSAGNILAGVYDVFGAGNDKRLFSLPFSQFVKGTSEVRSYFNIGSKNTLASRLFIGAGYAYGNSTVIPYSEQFYIGGANSIRAFTIRSIGPGSYHPAETTKYSYLDQTGDFKIEANVEFRFGILGGLKGAVFADAGNIWLLRDDPNRPGGVLTFKNFFNDIAVGTGVGLRFDISFLVLRADLGVGIHVPYDTGKTGYYNIPRFKDGLGFHFAIGYPF